MKFQKNSMSRFWEQLITGKLIYCEDLNKRPGALKYFTRPLIKFLNFLPWWFECLPLLSLDIIRKLNVHKTFRRSPGHLLNVSCTFNLRPVSRGLDAFDMMTQSIIHYEKLSLLRTSNNEQDWTPVKYLNVFTAVMAGNDPS